MRPASAAPKRRSGTPARTRRAHRGHRSGRAGTARSPGILAVRARADASSFLREGAPELLLERGAQDIQLLAVTRPGPRIDGPPDPVQRPARSHDLRLPLIEAIEHRRPGAPFSGAGRDPDRRGWRAGRNRLWRR